MEIEKKKEIGDKMENHGLEGPGNNHKDGDHDSGVDESTQEKEGLTRELSPKPIEEKPLVINKPSEIPVSPTKSATKIPSVPASPTKSSSSQIKSEPCSINNDDTPKKKLPMNKVQVGTAPSPNIKVVTSKIGSLNNTSYKPSGGNVKIESRKIVIEAKPRIGARNENYKPSGGDKKIVSQKLKWEAKSKIGSLDNTKHKPGGGKIKIETVKLDFSEKAKSKVGSTVNLKHVPGGGAVKIETVHLDFTEKAQSKVGSLDNIDHKPAGGEKKNFDDKEYLRQASHKSSTLHGSDNRLSMSPAPPMSPNPPMSEDGNAK